MAYHAALSRLRLGFEFRLGRFFLSFDCAGLMCVCCPSSVVAYHAALSRLRLGFEFRLGRFVFSDRFCITFPTAWLKLKKEDGFQTRRDFAFAHLTRILNSSAGDGPAANASEYMEYASVKFFSCSKMIPLKNRTSDRFSGPAARQAS